jgi:hypothetical protein
LFLAAIAAARLNLKFAVFDEAQGAHAIPFDFIEPVGSFGRNGNCGREHCLGRRRQCALMRTFKIGRSEGRGVFGNLLLGAFGCDAPGGLFNIVLGNNVFVLLFNE